MPRKLSNTEAAEARVLRSTMHLPINYLAELFEIGEPTMHNLIHGDTYMDAGGPIEPVGSLKPRKPAQHGSKAMYNKHGCRCEPCRDANKKACRAWREARKSNR